MTEQELIKIVGKNIYKYRTHLGMTQSRLAELSGVGATFISRVERGEKSMKLSTLYCVSNALGVSCDALLTQDTRTHILMLNIEKMLRDKSVKLVGGVEEIVRVLINQFEDESEI